MTPQQRREIQRHLDNFDFSGLFTDASIGWDWPDVGDTLTIPFDDDFIRLEAVAEKRGVKVLLCPPMVDGSLPDSKQRRAIEKATRPHAAEHLLIFTDGAKTKQVWQWVQQQKGKPQAFREATWEQNRSNEALIQKISSIAFTLDEEDALDITGVVQRLTDNLDRDRVTKKFYDQFKKQKDAFAKFIDGLSDAGLKPWYTSLMLNRIMFCYFLQRKGFLDGDQNYLHNRLNTIQETIGEDSFHSFYRTFLRRLFHEGLGEHPDQREQELQSLIGTIPYLNGGIFDEHPIERAHPDLHIPDEAFEKVFAFFDQYDWHLDDRPISDGNEINPEILGYVFEKYTNQKEMGAYYTKEDITEYISKNCIIPFLFQKIADKLPADAWHRLVDDPDRYIYPAVRHGAHKTRQEWQDSLPDNIACGLEPDTLHDIVELDKAVKTLELRKDWNTPAPASHALPTEIWRETIARHQRCHDLRDQLRAGEVTSIDQFITLNLDIRQFAQDLVDHADASLLLAFFKALKNVSVLDPTCGSGAFLFAALEILQPLYLACIERMRSLLADWESSGENHPNWQREITTILVHADSHPNESYYIHKTIIVHNLYGVDIMEEAVEICKLRLFLKLAAQLEQGQEVEPLPDIDFNIRAGNTLVGYATRGEIRRAFTEAQGDGGGTQMALQGIENSLDDFRTIMEQAEDADRAFQRFHQLQEDTATAPEDLRSAKQALNQVLDALRQQLDRFLAADYDPRNLDTDEKFKAWQNSYQPFHWFIEFYGIMNGGGFDVIIGNPPYLETRKIAGKYSPCKLKTSACGNLYAFVTERSNHLGGRSSFMGLIVPIGVTGVNETISLRTHLKDAYELLWTSNYAIRPAKLFTGVEQRLTIVIAQSGIRLCRTNATKYHQWLTEERPQIFQNLAYTDVSSLVEHDKYNRIPKIGTTTELSICSKLASTNNTLRHLLKKGTKGTLIFHRTPGYWIRIMDFEPYFKSPSQTRSIHHIRELNIDDENTSKACGAIVSSSLYFWYFFATGNCRNLTYDDVYEFKVNDSLPPVMDKAELLFTRLMENFRENSNIKSRGNTEFEEFDWPRAKLDVDAIDKCISPMFGLTEDEIDFIINYDIKIRLGIRES